MCACLNAKSHCLYSVNVYKKPDGRIKEGQLVYQFMFNFSSKFLLKTQGTIVCPDPLGVPATILEGSMTHLITNYVLEPLSQDLGTIKLKVL